MPRKLTVRERAIKAGYRSGLEEQTAIYLKKKGVTFTYEEQKIKWDDFKVRTYTPDFVLANGIIIETKGRFTGTDRMKHLSIRNSTEQSMTLGLYSVTVEQSYTRELRVATEIGVRSTGSSTQTKRSPKNG